MVVTTSMIPSLFANFLSHGRARSALYSRASATFALSMSIACSGQSTDSRPSIDTATSESPTDDSGANSGRASTGNTPSIPTSGILYGQHHPNGDAAIDYAYGPEGLWRRMSPISYGPGIYDSWANSAHPVDASLVSSLANGEQLLTAPDQDGHLLLDLNHDGEIDSTYGGFAFFSNNGRGSRGDSISKPRTLFLYEDNWLATYVGNAYGSAIPSGLSDRADFNRWRVLGGDLTAWKEVDDAPQIDIDIFNGLYEVSKGLWPAASKSWSKVLEKSGASYNSSEQRYTYSRIASTYQLAMTKILNDLLNDMPNTGIDDATHSSMLQHSISMRSKLLSLQEKRGSNLLGWRSQASESSSPIETKATMLSLLALGVGARHVFEAGTGALPTANASFQVSDTATLSATLGKSKEGYMTHGPGIQMAPGSYKVDFIIRTTNPTVKAGFIDVVDSTSGQVLASQDLDSTNLATYNQWVKITLDIKLTDPTNKLDFRTFWAGNAGLDIACIVVR